MNFPTFFPEGCPPEDAPEANGCFFRIIPDKPGRQLKAKHFKSHREKQPDRDFSPKPECQVCSISLIENLDEAKSFARTLIETIPAFRDYEPLLARGVLEPPHGRIKHTPDVENGVQSHHDWWKFETVDCLSIFSFLDLNSSNA